MLKIHRLAVVLLLLPHCGYTLRHRLKDSFSHPKGIFVPVFDNHSDETGAEQLFTNALIRELLSRNEVVVTDKKRAGLELRGTIHAIDSSATSHTPYGFEGRLQPYRQLPSEIGVRVTLWLGLVDLSNGNLLWQKSFDGFRRVNAPLNRSYDFQAPSSIGLTTQSIVRSIFPDIARAIMRDVYDEMVELF